MSWLVLVIAITNSFTLGVLIGWVHAQKNIATGCKKLGAFYVGDDVFHCTKINNFKDEEE